MDLSSMSDSDLQAIAGQGALASISNGILGQESGHNPNIGSSIDGAIGQAQIMPGTFAQYAKPGEDINNPADNLAVHQRIIQDLSDKSGGDPARIAVGYFSGPGNIAPPDSPTPWKNDLKDGNGKSVSSYVSDVLGRINPVSSANAADSQPDLSHLSDEQLQSIAGAGQTDPSGMGAQPWSALHIQSEALPDVAPPSQLDNARNALANQNTSGLRGFLAHETAMGANAISGIPGLKETGSALAALVGAGQGDTFGQRYNNLENAQAAMRQAGQEADPAASTLAKIGGITGGLALGGKLLGAALPERAATALSAFAEAHPYYAGMAGNGALGALYGLGDGTDAESRLKGAVSNGLIDAVASVPLTYAANTVLPALIGKIAPILTEAKAPLLGGDLPLAENAAAKTVAPATAAAVANQIVPQNS